jgi:hypothetical protein
MASVANPLYIAGVVTLVPASALLSGGAANHGWGRLVDCELLTLAHSPAAHHPLANRNPHPPSAPGLTLGLLSLDPLQLQVQQKSGARRAAAQAARLLPLVARTHQVLVAVVLCNAALSAALPLCLDRLLDPVAAILISSTAVVLFSEIVPQALFSRFCIPICSFFAPLLHAILWLFSPAAFPLAFVLDLALGRPGGDALFERQELRAVIALHAQEGEATLPGCESAACMFRSTA